MAMPFLTVMALGLKEKFSILTALALTSGAAGCAVTGAGVVRGALVRPFP